MANNDPVLITGGAGFIGAATARALLERGTPVVLFDQEPATAISADDPIGTAQFVSGDVLDSYGLARAIQANAVSRIVHAAGVVGAGLSIDGPARTVAVNMLGMSNVLEAALTFALGRIVFISSQSVYGPGRYAPVDEAHPTDPDSPYGATKIANEKLGQAYAGCFGVDFVALRMPHVYGPGRPSGLRGNVIQDMLVAARSGRPYEMAAGGDQHKEPTYVADVTKAILASLDVPATRLRGRAYNVGLGQTYTWREIADAVRALYPNAVLELGPGPIVVRPGVLEQPLGALKLDLARQVLGYEPSFGLAEGLIDFARFLDAG